MRTPTSRSRRVLLSSLAVTALGLGLVACGSDNAADKGTKTSTVDTAGELGVIGQWARATPADATNGAAYFTIQSSKADTLLGVKVDAAVAAMAGMHETVMMPTETTMAMGGSTAMGSDTTMAMGSGGMTMQPVESVDIPAGEDVVFEPGGKHIMLMDLVKPLAVGDSFQLTLTFENAGDLTIDVPVLAEAP